MPLIGSLAGMSVKDYIVDYDHWVAFGLLAAVGGKMIYESFKIESAEKNLDPSNVLVLLILALATSIDALAIGITLSLIVSSITVAVIIIGLVTFVLSYLGVLNETPRQICEVEYVERMNGLDATETGCWYPAVKPGQKISKDQKLGEIRDYFGKTLVEYTAPCDGTMLYVISSLAINTGDPIVAWGEYQA